MTATLGLVLLGSLLAASQAPPQKPPEGRDPRPITAQFIAGSTLRLCQTNTTKTEDYLIEELLPWSNRYSIILIATRAGGTGTEVLVQPLVNEHGLIRGISLPSGRRICGDVDLDDRLPQLRELREKDDVIVFWSCFGKGPPPAKDRLYGGAFLVPRSKQP